MRLSICIGCDNHVFLTNLNGAVNDATQMFSALTDVSIGQYDLTESVLLCNPTWIDFRSKLIEIASKKGIDDFTFYFAGHAGVAFETLYLAFSDTSFDNIASTGFPFSEIAKIILASKPVQANFILDACNSAGLGFNLQPVLNRSLTGTSEDTGISALAAAGADENALEYGDGGAFTTSDTEGRYVCTAT